MSGCNPIVSQGASVILYSVKCSEENKQTGHGVKEESPPEGETFEWRFRHINIWRLVFQEEGSAGDKS